MPPYALGTFSIENGPKFTGLVRDGEVVSLAELAAGGGDTAAVASHSVLDLLSDWTRNEPLLDQIALFPGTDLTWLPVDALVIHPPVDLPRQIFCTGANYGKHVIDMTLDMGVGPEGMTHDELRIWAADMMDERAATGEPYVFTKVVSTIAGPNDMLVLPDTTTQPDWELELGVIIGLGGYRIARADAMRHVAGYAIVNDISARDLIARTDYKMLGTDWMRAKGQPGFLPFGPYLVPAKFVTDPMNLRMRLSVEGQIMQDETTADMIFDIARQIEYISSFARLLPGDLICTGSPAGNGTHYNRYLRDGDLMIGEIEGLGAQRIRCRAG